MSFSDLIWLSASWHVCKIVTTGALACNSSVCISISTSLPAKLSTSFLQLRWPDCVHVSRPSLLLACYAVCKKGLSVKLGQSLASVWTFISASIATCVTTNTSASTLSSVLPSVLFSSALQIAYCVSRICNCIAFSFSQ